MQHRVTIREFNAKCAAERRPFPVVANLVVTGDKNQARTRKLVEQAVADKIGAGRCIRSIAHVVGGGFDVTVTPAG
jgi:hypothetical protein